MPSHKPQIDTNKQVIHQLSANERKAISIAVKWRFIPPGFTGSVAGLLRRVTGFCGLEDSGFCDLGLPHVLA